MFTKLITITNARKNLFKMAEEVQGASARYIITINGKPEMVLISTEEFDTMMKRVKDTKFDPKDFFGPDSLILRDKSEVKYKVRKRK